MKRKRNMITLAFFLTLAMLVLVGTYVTPTANAIDELAILNKNTDEGFASFNDGGSSLSDGSSESKIKDYTTDDKKEKTLEEEKRKLKEEFGIVDNKKKDDSINLKNNENEMVGYLDSLEKIRENYFEIEQEIKRLEKMKEDLKIKDEELSQTNNEIYLLRRELMGFKEEAKVKKNGFLSNTFTLINLGIFAMIILFTRGRRQIDIHKEKYYYFGKRRKHYHRKKA